MDRQYKGRCENHEYGHQGYSRDDYGQRSGDALLTLSNFQGHAPIAGLDKISTDIWSRAVPLR